MSKTNRILPSTVRAILLNARNAFVQRPMITAISLAMSGIAVPAFGADLPQPCVAGGCGANATSFSNGAATATISGNTMNVQQNTNSAVLNWRSFNISQDATVTFQQPNSASTALNRIFDANPSNILGSLNANGHVYLLNQNGIVFGSGSRVNVAGLLATSLDFAPLALQEGLLAPGMQNRAPALGMFDNEQTRGDINVQRGATITTESGGQVLMFAPNITNQGAIKTPGGQTMLAAGTSVYLLSGDANLRGLLVEVGTGGTVTNGEQANSTVEDPSQLVGQIIAERGNVTLAGLAVNQLGRVSASTSIRENGSIRLIARDGGSIEGSLENPKLEASHGGDLYLGQRSRTEISLDNSAGVTVDATAQARSTVELEGSRIVIDANSSIAATNGDVTLTARPRTALQTNAFTNSSDGSRIFLGDHATIDVSGARIDKPMESNVLNVELRGSQLADSPMQRDGALRGETVQVDIRQTGTRADGTTWVGSPIGELAGDVATIQHGVSERSLNGGTVTLRSQGDVITSSTSVIDISGGAINFASGYVNTSVLIGADGRAYNIGSADRDRQYRGIATGAVAAREHSRWGVTETYIGSGAGTFEAGYVEGKDAGSLTMFAPNMSFNGTIRANVETGRYQRRVAGTVPANSLYRPFDQLPLAGLLRVGQVETSAAVSSQDAGYVLTDIRITSTTQQLPLSAVFNPWTDAFAGTEGLLELRTDLFGVDGIGRLFARSNESFDLTQGAQLNLGVGGQLNVLSDDIDIGGIVRAAAGNITFRSVFTEATASTPGALRLRRGSALDVSGQWINDTPSLAHAPEYAPLAINGGSVSLQSTANALILESGSLVDVSGGAQLAASGKLNAGNAGSITLTAQRTFDGVTSPVQLDGELRAYAFLQGGTLQLNFDAFCIANVAVACKEDANESLVRLLPSFFSQNGFANYSLSTAQGGIEVAPGTEITLRAQNLLPSGALSNFASGTDIGAFTQVGELESWLRRPVNLTLTARQQLDRVTPFTAQTFATAPNVEFGTGASINAEIGARVAIESSTRILIDGSIYTPSGSIDLLLNSSLVATETGDPYFRDQGIWLGDHARLFATGATRLLTDTSGRTNGDVLSGGSVNVRAVRGHVLTSAGSIIDVSGTTGQVDVRSDASGMNYERRNIGSSGGALSIAASESIVLGGAFHGDAGAANATAGVLRVGLDPTQRNDPGQQLSVDRESRFPSMQRSIEITQSNSSLVFGSANLPSNFQGRALLSANQIEASGFGTVELTSRSFVTEDLGQAVSHIGEVLFRGNVNLNLAQRFVIDAAAMRSDGGNVTLHAPLLSLGHSTPWLGSSPASIEGAGRLHAQGGLVEFVGHTTLQGFDAASFTTGDLQLRGISLTGTSQSLPAGSLTTSGSLTLSAQQIYPTTLTNFSLRSGTDGSGDLTILQNGVAGNVMSAGGQLSLSGPRIIQSGTLRAPFGVITFDSPDIQLTNGSVTSTSGVGVTTLFGQTQGGFDWVYSLLNTDIIFGAGDGNTPLPAQRINLNGANVNVATGATLDVRGGGDLLATEFVPGTTGTRDVLSAALSPDSFAVLPRSQLAAAPYDPQLYADSKLPIGQSVYLSGDGNLPAGEYVIVPARYALLPGAYLVKPVSGHQDIVAGERYVQADGSTIVSGYYTATGTELRDSRTRGFAILSGDAIQQRARYTVTNANDFFDAQADAAAVSAGRLPRDAGVVSIAAQQTLALNGSLRASAAEGGRGAAVDIASNAIRIVSDNDSSSTAGVLAVRASNLNQLGAESLLIGGTRTDADDGVSIATTASSVTVGAGATLSGPEVILVGRERVAVEGNATIRAAGSTAESQDFRVEGDGALLRVANARVNSVTRENGNTGLLDLAQGSTLNAGQGSIHLESAAQANLRGNLLVNGGGLGLTGESITLGSSSGSQTGNNLRVTSEQLNALGLAELSLNGRNGITLDGGIDIDVQRLTIATPTLSSAGGVNTFDVSGDAVLRGAQSVTAPIGQGELVLNADNILLDGGTLSTGFSRVALNAQSEVRGERDTNLDAQGALEIRADRITTRSGVDVDIDADGSALIAGNNAPAATPVSDLGGLLSVTASRVDVSGRIELPSGIVELQSNAAAGGVTLHETAVIDVSGRSTTFADRQVASSGGTVRLDAASGNVQMTTGSLVSVAAAGNASSGRIEVEAAQGQLIAQGTLQGGSQAEIDGGSFIATANTLGDINALNRSLNAGGFFGERSVTQRGTGDIVLAADTQAAMRGTRVTVVADQGAIRVDGSIRAHDDQGGRVLLAARDGLAINGTIDVRALNATERNGQIDFQSTTGGLQVAQNAVIATVSSAAASGSAADGSVHVRLPQTALLTAIDADTNNDAVELSGNWSAAGDVTIEGFRAYTVGDANTEAVLGDSDVLADASNRYYADALSFSNQASAIQTVFARNSTLSNSQVLSGIEIDAVNDLRLVSDWDMYGAEGTGWRFNNSPGVLTLRAGGDLLLDGSLSDGFAGVSGAGAFTLTNTADTWSYRLIGGANRTSAAVLATQSSNARGDVIVNANGSGSRMIRTGTGSIDIRAARNISLADSGSTIYTSGIATDGIAFNRDTRQFGNQLNGLKYPEHGGDITMVAGGDVAGAANDQLINSWLWRIGNTTNADANRRRSTAWTVNFQQFQQNVGALGGGDVEVIAGGNVNTLSVSTPTIGRQVGGITPDLSSLEVIGGGDVAVRAGNDIVGGVYYSGRGQISLQAGRSIGAGDQSQGVTNAPIIALGDTQAELTARRDVAIASVLTPTLLPQGISQVAATGSAATFATRSLFSTYTSASAIDVNAIAGNVELGTRNEGELSALYSSIGFDGTEATTLAFHLYPATVEATSLRGDVNIDGAMTLYPDAHGRLNVQAFDDVTFGNHVSLLVSDVDPTKLPSIAAPVTDWGSIPDAMRLVLSSILQPDDSSGAYALSHATTPVRLSAARDGTLQSSRLIAAQGDVFMKNEGGGLYFGGPVDIHAGRDVHQLDAVIQNLTVADVSTIQAGRDISYATTRLDDGAIAPNSRQIVVDGPGQLLLSVGRNINLQASSGISTRGNSGNTALAENGAGIIAITGLNGKQPDYVAFANAYLRDSEAHANALIAYVELITGVKPATRQVALAAFNSLSNAQRAVLLTQIFFRELRDSGRYAASADPRQRNDFTAGYRALETLFPGSNPAEDETNPYSGDLALFFSRLYTLDGGDISMLAPGGEINAGLATPPSAFGIPKPADQLGVVARRTGNINALSFNDLQVNESRIFGVDGGNILIWSTAGDIDAGRGAKTAISAPSPIIAFDRDGRATLTYQAALAGSGIQTRSTRGDTPPGDVDLFAPKGVVNAGDAGIVAGNLTIAATAVLGADNIKVSGVSVGVPVDAGGLGASLAGVSSVASSASNSASMAVDSNDQDKEQAPMAAAALSWLEVFVVGLGEDACKQDDMECLKRQK